MILTHYFRLTGLRCLYRFNLFRDLSEIGRCQYESAYLPKKVPDKMPREGISKKSVPTIRI